MGGTMKHFTTEEWIDFVNQAVSPRGREEMGNHLKQGCKRCRETVSLWQRVQKFAAAETSYQPPAATLRIAKAAFAASRLGSQRKKSRSRISVLFDSFLQPAAAGARSAAIDSRQMLYRVANPDDQGSLAAAQHAITALVPQGALAAASTWLALRTGADTTANLMVPILLAFAAFAFLAAAFIVVNVVTGVVLGNLRQIGLLKSIGATPGQVAATLVVQVVVPAHGPHGPTAKPAS